MAGKTWLRRIFRKAAAPFVLAAGFLAVAPEGIAQEPAARTEITVDACPAFPDFKNPVMPMHRMRREVDPDPMLQAQQEILRAISIDPGRIDGRLGSGTRHAVREFLILHAPLYGGISDKWELAPEDMRHLEAFRARAADFARAQGLKNETAAALLLAAERTGVDAARLAAKAKTGGQLPGVSAAGAQPAHLFKFDNASWLYLVKTHGAAYGLGFYAGQIALATSAKGALLEVENPFVHRQILNLRQNKRLASLLAAEALRNPLPLLEKKSLPPFSTGVQRQQEALLALGFDIGSPRADGIRGTITEIALREFQVIFGGEGAVPTGRLTAEEAAWLQTAAQEAKAEAARLRVPVSAIGAIRHASEKNDMEFGYMMELAAAESAFIHNVKARTSSATGLYQFIESTWHFVVMLHGDKYGLSPFAGEVEIYKDDLNREQARIANPFVRREVIEMRKHPYLASLFSAEFQQENLEKQKCFVEKGAISRTDLYLAHFLGAHDAIYFINKMKEDPKASAARTFPEAAEYNKGVFYVMSGRRILRERTLEEVYGLFARKFDRGLYEGTVLVEDRTPQEKTARLKPAGPQG